MCSGYITVHYNVGTEASKVFSHECHYNEFWLEWFTLQISHVSLLARDVLPATKACLCTFIWPSLAKVGSPTHSPLHWKRIWSLLPSGVNILVCIAKSGRDLCASWICLWCFYQTYANRDVATFQQWVEYIEIMLNIRILNKTLCFIDFLSQWKHCAYSSFISLLFFISLHSCNFCSA